MSLPINKCCSWFYLFSLFFAATLSASTPEDVFPEQVRLALEQRNPDAYMALVTSDPATQQTERSFFNSVLAFPYTAVVLRVASRDPGKIIVQLFFQNQNESRFEAWSIQTVEEDGKIKIKKRDTRSSIGGLYRLELKREGIPVSNFDLQQQDAVFHLKKGMMFVILTGDEPAGVVFLGDGSFEFTPRDPIEKQQLTLFSKKEEIRTKMDHLYIRSSPENLQDILGTLLSTPGRSDPDDYAHALAIEKGYDADAFSVKVPLSEEIWYPRLERSELFCEMKTSYGTLIYQHSPRNSEDVLLSLKEKNQIISYYNSSGLSIVDTTKDAVEIMSYDMKVSFNPESEYLSGVAKIKLRTTQESSSIALKLNPYLRVSQIQSDQGPLLYFQQRETSKLQVVLNDFLKEAEEISLEVSYQGRIQPDEGKAEVAALAEGQANVYIPPTTLYSNQSRWYPQLDSDPYLAMMLSISVPAGYTAITNGIQKKIVKENERTIFYYQQDQPVKYFSLLVGRFDGVFSFDSIVPIKVYYFDTDKSLSVQYASNADKILRFYSNYFGPFPYQNLTIALRPLLTEGGHAPATMVILNRVYTYFNIKSRKDPMNVPDFPVFLLAHELAHQWWGQAVGWRTYRDQWLSEGFAQFGAAEFIRNQDGEEAWNKLSKNFCEWIETKSNAGPLILGARLGHLINDRQAYTALLYNKGAYILNMLKLWLGPEAFSKCLMEYLKTYQFQRVGISEFEQIAQKYSTENLEPFFHQWLWQWHTPEIWWSEKIDREGPTSSVQLRFVQSDKDFFRMKIPVEAKGKDGKVFRTMVSVNNPDEEASISVPFDVSSVLIDPQRENLMIANEIRKK
jgi:Peptidase family M1 domain/Peptidase M1 N-terminal domain